MTRRRMIASVVSVLAVPAGGGLVSCAGGGGVVRPTGAAVASAGTSAAAAATSTASAAVPVVDDCVVRMGVPTAAIPVQGPGGALLAEVLGRGHRTVVMSHQSDEELCSWVPLAQRLVGEGYRVVLWNYAWGAPVDELGAVVAAVRGTDAGPVVLLGSSKGAKTSIVAAAGLRPAVAGVVSISAEEVLHPAITVSDYVPRLPCPLLLLTSQTDPWGSHTAAEKFSAAARPGTVQVVTLPGSAHGVDLLTGLTADTALTAIDGFLERVLGAA